MLRWIAAFALLVAVLDCRTASADEAAGRVVQTHEELVVRVVVDRYAPNAVMAVGAVVPTRPDGQWLVWIAGANYDEGYAVPDPVVPVILRVRRVDAEEPDEEDLLIFRRRAAGHVLPSDTIEIRIYYWWYEPGYKEIPTQVWPCAATAEQIRCRPKH